MSQVGEAIEGTLLISSTGGIPICVLNYEKDGSTINLLKKSKIKAGISGFTPTLEAIKLFSSKLTGKDINEIMIESNPPIIIQFFKKGDLTYFNICDNSTNFKEIVENKIKINPVPAIKNLPDEQTEIIIKETITPKEEKELFKKNFDAQDRRVIALLKGLPSLINEGTISEHQESEVSIDSLWSNRKNLKTSGPKEVARQYLTAHILKEELRNADFKSMEFNEKKEFYFFKRLSKNLNKEVSDDFSSNIDLLTTFFLRNIYNIFGLSKNFSTLLVDEYSDLKITNEEEFKEAFKKSFIKVFFNPTFLDKKEEEFKFLIGVLGSINSLVGGFDRKSVNVLISIGKKAFIFKTSD